MKIYSARTIKALNLAYTAHQGQLDKIGVPYIDHVLSVANSDLITNIQETIVALLHDILEDTPTTVNDLKMAGFNAATIAAIQLLTKNKNEDYSAYIDRLIQSGNTLAIKVKLADLKHNLTPGRLMRLPYAIRKRLTDKYTGVRNLLEEVLWEETHGK